jgi:lysophospholipid acyltransferase (LPLAT)-like uncharacterized protein
MLKRLAKKAWIRKAAGNFLAGYVRFVEKTSRMIVEPDTYPAWIPPHLPVIVTTWHGQHFMIPISRPRGVDVRVIISRSNDGEINAVAAHKLGVGTIRASGGQTAAQNRRRGGSRGFLEALTCLNGGATVALSADVPKGPARVCGKGLVKLAMHSGRPVLPMAITTSWRIVLDNWDKTTINLPFGKMALVVGDPIYVPKQIEGEEFEKYRLSIEQALDHVADRANALVDG